MYENHATRVQAYAQEAPENLTRVIGFVLTTIRQPIERAPLDVRDVDENGENAAILWGFKRAGYVFARDNARELYDACMQAHARDDDARLIHALLAVPGLGLAKAGFVAQLAFGRVGCLDTHNLRRLGLDPQQFTTTGLKRDGKALTRKITRYLDACLRAGGCRQLWDDWCELVARERPSVFDQLADDGTSGAYAVSRLHVEALGL